MEESKKKEIIEYIIKTRSVSFAELNNRFEGFSGGEYCFGFEDKNIWFWVGMTGDAIDLIADAIRDGQIKMTPTTPLVYLIDGGSLNLPIAKQVRNYKSERWMPVVLNPA